MEEYFGGTLYVPTDEEVERMINGFSLDEVCRYHREKGGVACNQKRRTDYDCEHCGWNPRVARRRSRKIRERMEFEGK